MFKKLVFSMAIFLGIPSLSMAWDFEKNPDRNGFIKYTQTLTTVVVSTSAVLIDVSDTTNWPHGETGEVQINFIRVSVDKAAASTATVGIGVVTALSASNGNVTWVYGLSSLHNVSNTSLGEVVDFQPSWIGLKAIPADGSTPDILSNDTTSASSVYQNDTILPSTSGTDVAPAVGDIVLELTKPGTGTTAIFTVEALYHVIRR